jgi:hypothetical protein
VEVQILFRPLLTSSLYPRSLVHRDQTLSVKQLKRPLSIVGATLAAGSLLAALVTRPIAPTYRWERPSDQRQSRFLEHLLVLNLEWAVSAESPAVAGERGRPRDPNPGDRRPSAVPGHSLRTLSPAVFWLLAIVAIAHLSQRFPHPTRPRSPPKPRRT